MKASKTRTNSGGYHVAWLIPMEGLFAFSMLTVSLKFGFGAAFLVVLPIFGYVIKKIADNEPKVTYDIESWSNAMELSIQNDQEIPSLESYAVIEHKQKKTRVAKRRIIGSRPSSAQIKIPTRIRTKKQAFQPEF